ncbi:MAG: TM0106 family RecB-like putative nuclease [Burkholderiales bacterium]|nr:TM0106 family RecB-like putative nuclease [Burkholderiales bacterium]
MQLRDGTYLYSATDLVGYLECEHLTALDFQSLGDSGLRSARAVPDESAELIARKGDEHERAYLKRLRLQGRVVVDIAEDGGGIEDRIARTQEAMRRGAEVIYQATLRDGPFFGHADFLRRIDGQPSDLGDWRYEVADTKLARSAKAKFLVQLAFYSALLAKAQGAEPRLMHVVLGDQTERAFRCADYMHYYRALVGRFMARVQSLAVGSSSDTYPLPVSHCDLCHWRDRCEARRVADDHLCQVANISRVQWLKLEAAGVDTMARLAALPPGAQIPRLHADTLERIRSQAELQERARRTGVREVVVLPLDPEARRGFHRLPPPDAGDMFFDMEGDPLDDGGLEYLFGVWFRDGGPWTFLPFWAHTRAEERTAFEDFIDFATRRRQQFPGAHIYHYASYEETALKRLACWHATREAEVDNLLRQGVLVDLYKVVREGVRISEPSYSIKYVEHFYRPARAGDVQNAGASIVYYERWRETQDPQLLIDIGNYNRDDVESTQQLRDWLLTLRPAGMPWRSIGASAAEVTAGDTPALTKAQEAEQRLIPYRERLVDVLPTDRALWTSEQHACELTYQLLDFHRRADKPAWWALFDRMDREEAELLDDPECLAGLQLDPTCPPRPDKRSTIYTYVAPEQESKISSGDDCTRTDTAEALGKIDFDVASRRVTIRLGPSRQPLPPRVSLGLGGPINSKGLIDALFRFADSVLAGDERHLALKRLLRREPPRLTGWSPGQSIVPPGLDIVQGSLAAAMAMDDTCLYVQGPPGSGKTYTGSRMIAGLLATGRRVGIMSNSHKAINHLLEGVMQVMAERGLPVRAVKKAARDRPDTQYEDEFGNVQNLYVNEDVWASDAQLVAGTAWLFSDPAAEQALDVLFVDEAGQVALANLVAAGTSARNIVLLGDQMQLSQPVQGVHPGRSGDSALDWLLDGAATIAPDRGIFLATSHRMHPDVCRFISDAVYDGRLEPERSNERRMLVLGADAHPLLRPAGIVHAAIAHEGCSQSSPPEAALVAEIYASALRQRRTDKDGVEHPMTAANIVVVAPYNVQVNLLKRTLPDDARVGTVDKFQGQEAELVIVSMTTSSEQDLPRHLEFLYSKNRLNVAVSRAKCLAIVIANPALTAIKCHTPEQMALVNTLCWVAEAGSKSLFGNAAAPEPRAQRLHG